MFDSIRKTQNEKGASFSVKVDETLCNDKAYKQKIVYEM